MLTACLNFRVSHNLIRSSPPRVTTVRPSALMSIPPVHVSFLCASLISADGREYGPLPPHITRLPSYAAATRRLLDPCAEEPHTTAVILVLPADPAALDLCTMTSFCDRFRLTSHILNVLSVPAVTQRFLSVGCHVPEDISEMWPFVLCMSLRYMSPFTNSTSSSPSLLNSFACGVAGIMRT